ncbi:MAG: peptidylprolyl isomerase [Actinomycetota bacterium]
MAKYDAPPSMQIDPTKTYAAVMRTSAGDITFELYADRAPVTVNNFAFLAREGFYDGTMFHRVIEGFMNQGGDPQGTGMGGPGYDFQDEFDPSLRFSEPNLLAMANAGPGTNGSQFFITTSAPGHLNDRHTIFGKVTEGHDVVASINRTPTDGRDRPLQDVTIESVDIRES